MIAVGHIVAAGGVVLGREPLARAGVGQALGDQLAANLAGRSLGVYGVNYPASYDFLAAADGAAARGRASAWLKVDTTLQLAPAIFRPV